MNNAVLVLEKYINKSYENALRGKTGWECEYCGGTEVQRNRYGVFCKGCAAPRKQLPGKLFGVPVYDPEDAYLAIGDLGYLGVLNDQ